MTSNNNTDRDIGIKRISLWDFEFDADCQTAGKLENVGGIFGMSYTVHNILVLQYLPVGQSKHDYKTQNKGPNEDINININTCALWLKTNCFQGYTVRL